VRRCSSDGQSDNPYGHTNRVAHIRQTGKDTDRYRHKDRQTERER